MTIKPGVSITGIAPEAVLGLLVVATVFEQWGAHLTVTAVTDGKHMEGSLHYRGRAFDLRLPEQKDLIVRELQSALGKQWDVVLEKDHIHVEFDPKEGKP